MIQRWVLLLLLVLDATTVAAAVAAEAASGENIALLDFKYKADPTNKLSFTLSTSQCNWTGVQCDALLRVTRLLLQSQSLTGTFPPETITRLGHLRILNLTNNSLSGPIPDLSKLTRLKSLFLSQNQFSQILPPSISYLPGIRDVDISGNNLTGHISPLFASIRSLYSFRLEWNRLQGPVPPLNQTTLLYFNVSGNSLSGPVPVTEALLRFGESSFLYNPGLCGEIVRRECREASPFFVLSPAPKGSYDGGEIGVRRNYDKEQGRNGFVIGLGFGVLVFAVAVVVVVGWLFARRKRKRSISRAMGLSQEDAPVMRIEAENELVAEKVKAAQVAVASKSGNLIFCAGESQTYTTEQLMRANAELIGKRKGTMGSTYKAVLDNHEIICVKRLDTGKTAGTTRDAYERHMETVGSLRHSNLVPLRAYFQAKDERLLIYDYQPNGSLFSLIHGSKSSRAKPLHWTSCLKIAEDVAKGLSYIHQAWQLVHGNLKSSNVLLGPDFEACLSDYCLSTLSDLPAHYSDPDSDPYRAPETRGINSSHPATSKSDVYAFGILLLELLAGKPPCEHHPFMDPNDLVKWVGSTRGEFGNIRGEEEDVRMVMLLEVTVLCSSRLPEQRPTMWQVLKMIQEIKETAVLMDSDGQLNDPIVS